MLHGQSRHAHIGVGQDFLAQVYALNTRPVVAKLTTVERAFKEAFIVSRSSQVLEGSHGKRPLAGCWSRTSARLLVQGRRRYGFPFAGPLPTIEFLQGSVELTVVGRPVPK